MRLISFSILDDRPSIVEALKLQPTVVALTHHPAGELSDGTLVEVFSRLAPTLYLDPELRVLVSVGNWPLRDAVRVAAEVLNGSGCRDIRIAAVSGSDLRATMPAMLRDYAAVADRSTGRRLDQIQEPIIAAFVPTGADPIVEALDQAARIVICDHTPLGTLALAALQAAQPLGLHDWTQLAERAVLSIAIESHRRTPDDPRWVLVADNVARIEGAGPDSPALASDILSQAASVLPNLTVEPANILWHWREPNTLTASATKPASREMETSFVIKYQTAWEALVLDRDAEHANNDLFRFEADTPERLAELVDAKRRELLAQGRNFVAFPATPVTATWQSTLPRDAVTWDVKIQSAKRWL